MRRKSKITHGKFYYSYGISTVHPNDLSMRHCHDSYELLYVAEGNGKFVIEGREYPLRAHTLMVIPPLEYHYVDIDSEARYERCVIRFHEADVLADVRDCLAAFKRNPEDNSNFYICDLNIPTITSFIEQFEYADKIPEAKRALYLNMLLSEFILLLSVFESDKLVYDNEELGARVIRYLNEHIEKDVSLDALAKRFFVSKYYLCRAFKRHNGISVHGYINQKRVMYAKQLIEAGEGASSAAYKVGFGDYSAFYRAYVKIIGKAPTA